MTLFQIIMLISWGIFLFYWFINLQNVKPTLTKKMSLEWIRGIGLGVIVVLLLNHFLLHRSFKLPLCQWSVLGCHFSNPFFSIHQSIPIQIISVLLTLLGVAIAIVARKTLAGNWSSTLDVKKGHELVTTGIYHYIRHPIYTGVLLMLVAIFLAFFSATEFVIVTVVVVVFLIRIKKEEELMTEVFPKEYPEYKARTKALIPFIL